MLLVCAEVVPGVNVPNTDGGTFSQGQIDAGSGPGGDEIVGIGVVPPVFDTYFRGLSSWTRQDSVVAALVCAGDVIPITVVEGNESVRLLVAFVLLKYFGVKRTFLLLYRGRFVPFSWVEEVCFQ